MEVNKKLRDEIFGIIETQSVNNDSPETREALERLKGMGYSEFESKQLAGKCLAIEIFNVLKHGKEHNKERYARNLRNLPDEPAE